MAANTVAAELTQLEAEAVEEELPELVSERRSSVRKGWKRVGTKEDGFSYVNAQGKPITNARQLARIDGLHIPPAWTDVTISSNPKADLQAVGHDSAGRLQYLYHADFRARQDARKYAKLTKFARALPKIRQLTGTELSEGTGLSRERVLATVVRLINETYFRVGSEEYAEQNKTFGVTTLRKNHCAITPEGEICFTFKGKHSVEQNKIVADALLRDIIQELLRVPGPRLFKYLQITATEGLAEAGISAPSKPSRKNWKPVTSRLVNSYIKEVMGADFSAKDFRTWAGTLIAARTLAEIGPQDDPKKIKKALVDAVKRVAEELGNTPAVARSSYISPAVFAAYEQGRTIGRGIASAQRTIEAKQLDYEPEELALLRLLQMMPADAVPAVQP